MREVSENASLATPNKVVPQVSAPPEPVPQTMAWAEPPLRRRSSRGAFITAIIASLLAIGLGYLTSEQWQARQVAQATLAAAQQKLKTLTQEQAHSAITLAAQRDQLESQGQRLEQGASDLSDYKTRLGAAEARLHELEAQSEEQNGHLAEFRALTKQFQRMIDSGKLQINFRRGRMIVELPAAVLFASGSAELSTEGRQALQEIAKILRKVPGKRFIVGGHTDDVPIGKNAEAYKSNWALSAARAVTVTESLIGAGLRADHLVAAGYGEYDPIASNANERTRQKNRRIEIVLEPALAGLQGALADLKKDGAATKSATAADKH